MSAPWDRLQEELKALRSRIAELESRNYRPLPRKTDEGLRDSASRQDRSWVRSVVEMGVTYSAAEQTKLDGIATGAIADAYANVTDGVTTAAASGADTFKFRSANGILTATVASNDVTHGDNVLLTVDETLIDHDNLANFASNEHVKIEAGVAASRGTAAAFGVGYYFSTDTEVWSYSSGSAWTDITSGSGVSYSEPVVTKTADATLDTTEAVVYCFDTSGRNLVATMPAGVDDDKFVIKKIHPDNTLWIKGAGTEEFDQGTTLLFGAGIYRSVTVSFKTDTWYVRHDTTWDDLPLREFPIFQAHDSSNDVSSSVYGIFAMGGLALEHVTIDRAQHVIPIAGTIHSLRVQISATTTASNGWDLTLLVNETDTAMALSFIDGSQSENDLTNRIDVAAGDTIQWRFDEVGAMGSTRFIISAVFEATRQPMFGASGYLPGSGVAYGTVNAGGFSTTENQASVFPCAGTLKTFRIDDPGCNASGDEVTYELQQYSSGSWGTTLLTIVHNYTADGGPDKTDLVSEISVAAQDVLRWKVSNTGSGLTHYPSISCVFEPSNVGVDRVIMGCLDTYTEADASVGSGVQGSFDNASSISDQMANIPMQLNGTASDLYLALAADPGTSKWIAATLTRDGSTTSLTAKATSPAVTASDTSHSVAYVEGTHDIGMEISNSGDTPSSQAWVAWGFLLNRT